MSHEMPMAITSGHARCFRWKYQANVMKAFERINSPMVARMRMRVSVSRVLHG
jgi:hypothetical protein